MEYCPDSKRIYQHICCRMTLAISRSLELLEQGRWQEAGICCPGRRKRLTG